MTPHGIKGLIQLGHPIYMLFSQWFPGNIGNTNRNSEHLRNVFLILACKFSLTRSTWSFDKGYIPIFWIKYPLIIITILSPHPFGP